MQQFDAAALASHFQSLLRAVVHALENPFGSLSTTFEAIQVAFADSTAPHLDMRSLCWFIGTHAKLITK